MSSTAYGFVLPTPNQKRTFTQMLDDGVRCMMLDLYDWLGTTYLCHASCLGGSLKLVDGLNEIGAWLWSHPDDVVTLILESYVTPTATFEGLVSAGLADPTELPRVARYCTTTMRHPAAHGLPWRR